MTASVVQILLDRMAATDVRRGVAQAYPNSRCPRTPPGMPTYRGTCASYTLPALKSNAIDHPPDKPGKIMNHLCAWLISQRTVTPVSRIEWSMKWEEFIQEFQASGQSVSSRGAAQ